MCDPNDYILIKMNPCVSIQCQCESNCCNKAIVNQSNLRELVSKLRTSRIPAAVAYYQDCCKYVVVKADGTMCDYNPNDNLTDYIFCSPCVPANPSVQKCYLVCE
ncbi:hypothetical protein DMUE_5027 [Dictyocoela muelleri]|nr:hypothetical protein DMUE_5027 [Dictyocoela muelleri]